MARLTAPIASLRQRLSRGGGGDRSQPEPPLRDLGHRLQERREQLGLSMRQLALDTRVSTPVIEALEKGWVDRLPEAAFLGTIVQKLADRLDLDAGSINATLQEVLPANTNGAGRRDGPITRFTLSSIELFSTWQGTIAYAVLVSGVLYGLNLHHRQLLMAKLSSISPIPAAVVTGPATEKPSGASSDPTIANAEQQLLQLHPDLRPLDQPKPQPLQRLQSSNQEASTPPAMGKLELTLPENTKTDQVVVTWNGTPLKADAQVPNRYAVPLWPAPDAAVEAEEPQPR